MSLRLAIILSLALHGAALFVHLSQPEAVSGKASPPANAGLNVVLAPPAPQVQPQEKRPAAPKKQAASPRVLALHGGARQGANQPKWTRAERDEMNDFLNSLSPPPRPPSGHELAQQALAQARELGRQTDREGDVPRQPVQGKQADPFSLEMYFDAFVRKLNRSAAFVNREPRGNGRRKALVRITLNADGTLQSYQVLRAADQAVEIAYIKSVVERASPFSAFPPDIRKTMGTFSVLMCITPNQGGGDGFVPMGKGEECRD